MKKIFFISLTSILLFTGCEYTETSSNTQSTNNQPTTTEQTQKSTTDDGYVELLRKCTVMEASDLYQTGSTTGNVFDKAKETCEGFYKQLGNESFTEAVTTDWETRKNEEIEGHNLEYYKNQLSW